MNVSELRVVLKERGLEVKGKKVKIAARLRKAMVNSVQNVVSTDGAGEVAPTKVFGDDVVWTPLTPLAETLDDLNEGTIFHSPTVVEDEVSAVKKETLEK